MRLLEESLSCRRALGDTLGVADALRALAGLAHLLDADARALELYRESMALLRRLPSKHCIGACLEGTVLIAAASGRPEQAGRLLASADSLRAAIGVVLPPRDRAEDDRALSAVRGALGEAAFGAVWAVGRRVGMVDAIEEACELIAAPLHGDPTNTRPVSGQVHPAAQRIWTAP